MCFVVLQGMGTVLRAIILVMVSNLLCTPVVQLDPISTDISAFTFLLFIILYLPSWFYPQNYPDHVWQVERWRRFGSSRFWKNSSCVQLRKLRKLPNTVFFKFRAKQCCVLCCPVRAWDISVVTKRSSRSPVSLSSVQTQFCSCFWSVHSQSGHPGWLWLHQLECGDPEVVFRVPTMPESLWMPFSSVGPEQHRHPGCSASRFALYTLQIRAGMQSPSLDVVRKCVGVAAGNMA